MVESKPQKSGCAKNDPIPDVKFALDGGVKFAVFDSISSIAPEWDRLVPDEYFHQSPYLRTLEKSNRDNLSNLYVLIYNESSEPMGAILFQRLILTFSNSFRYEKYTTDRSYYSRMLQRFRQWVLALFSVRLITVGNLFLTGQYGFQFAPNSMDTQDQFKLVNKILRRLKKVLRKTPYCYSGVIYKDYFSSQRPTSPVKLGMEEFFIDPNMILKMRPSWLTFDDYLLDMRSKYRVRHRNAMKKFRGIERRMLDKDFIDQNYKEMFGLYDSILEGSGFVLAKGGETYFKNLKEELGEELNAVGYFLEDKLIAFYTWVLDHKKMDTHFIGLEPALNLKYQLYLNILLDLVRDAIEHKATEVYYFRTALEIKSSIGAEPVEMSCYFRHNNWLMNRLIVPLGFKYFVPVQSWKQRHPFKPVT
jgi:hypothetical protein